MERLTTSFLKNIVGGNGTQTINFGTGLSTSDAGQARKEFIAACKAQGIRVTAHGYNGHGGEGWWVTIKGNLPVLP